MRNVPEVLLHVPAKGIRNPSCFTSLFGPQERFAFSSSIFTLFLAVDSVKEVGSGRGGGIMFSGYGGRFLEKGLVQLFVVVM